MTFKSPTPEKITSESLKDRVATEIRAAIGDHIDPVSNELILKASSGGIQWDINEQKRLINRYEEDKKKLGTFDIAEKYELEDKITEAEEKLKNLESQLKQLKPENPSAN